MTETAETSLSTRYTPAEFEQDMYSAWERSGLMTPPAEGSGRETFTVMIPPPNVTGVLHMGHALNNTMQDIVVRHRRMLGFDVLWVPGTDHAGIATQAVVERKLAAEGRDRKEIGREAFTKEVWDWRAHHGDVILGQLKRLGATCDWSRTKFTLDPEMATAVRVSFVRMWEKGLVYRGARLVNWDCKLQTAVSDDEIEYVSRKGKIWTLHYPVKDSDETISVATTRPETMLGDTGVAVHPEDPRYGHLVGKTLLLPLVDREIPIVADDSVDPEFGTGAVKVTPGHDPADYERGARHKLPIINVLNNDGTMNEECGPYAGFTREKAREAILAAFEELELYGGEADITHNVTISDRSKTVIEPLISEQWFVRMSEMASPAIAAVKEGQLKFKPERWSKVYLDWLENVQDWCISRQLWWGHRIPVWYDEDNVPVASVEDLELGAPHPQTGKPLVRQDEDVLDTWGSSWLWPFATLGWPDEDSADLARFYPTQFLSTARDIIYLWVARMVMAGYAFLDKLPMEKRLPFSTCYIHATVLDGQGKRMSKSAGNGIDPVDMIEKYGADAVRFSLMILTREGQDVKLAENRFELGQRFCNKIWNVSRFVLQNLEGQAEALACPPAEGDLALEDRWIRSRAQATLMEVGQSLEEYDFHDAAQALYRFVWDDFCDWYVESAKRRLWAEEDATVDGLEARSAAAARYTLGTTLAQLLKMLHPLTPFLSEALWSEVPDVLKTEQGMLLGVAWPTSQTDHLDPASESRFAQLQDVVRALRNVRALLDIPAGDKPSATVLCDDVDTAVGLTSCGALSAFLARLESIECSTDAQKPERSGTDVFKGGAVFLPFTEETDPAKLRTSLEKKMQKVEKGIRGIEGKLGNERFLANADPEVVASERIRLEDLGVELKTLAANLDGLAD
ncbi:MAG: valine--tRNA ligase [Planctomycetota bacterium]|jgi:valyl-tRNA synthetase